MVTFSIFNIIQKALNNHFEKEVDYMENTLRNDYTLLDYFTYTNITAVGYPKFQKWCDLRGYHCRGIERPDFPEGQPDFAYMKDTNGKLHRLRKGIICVETNFSEEDVLDIESIVGDMIYEEIT